MLRTDVMTGMSQTMAGEFSGPSHAFIGNVCTTLLLIIMAAQYFIPMDLWRLVLSKIKSNLIKLHFSSTSFSLGRLQSPDFIKHVYSHMGL